MPYHRAEHLKIGIAALLGLALGLAIAWGIWPVQWTNATLEDLQPELQARYIAAVADAYVAAGAQEGALAIATRRLAGLADPQRALEDAIQFYQQGNEPDRNIRVNNLYLLRPLAAGQPPVAEGAVDLESEIQPEPVQAAPAIGWLTWGLLLVAAIVLVAGGIWVAYRIFWDEGFARAPSLRQRAVPLRSALENEPVVDLDEEQVPAYQRRRPQPGSPLPSVAPRPFEQVWDDWDDDDGLAGEPAYEDSEAEEDTWIEPEEEEGEDDETARIQAAEDESKVAQTTLVRPKPADSGSREPQPSAPSGEIHVDQAQLRRPATVEPTRRAAQSQAGTLLGTFVARYHLGIPDYDESFNLGQGEDQEPVGACGMGTNIEDALSGPADAIMALDVWLYDRSDIRSFNYILVSPHADLEAVRRRNPRSEHVTVAAEGLSFSLESNQLLLTCQVVEVDTVDTGDSQGAFSNVAVEMTVHHLENQAA